MNQITSFHESYYINAVALAAPDEQVYADLYRVTQYSTTAFLDWHYRWEYLAVMSRFRPNLVGRLSGWTAEPASDERAHRSALS